MNFGGQKRHATSELIPQVKRGKKILFRILIVQARVSHVTSERLEGSCLNVEKRKSPFSLNLRKVNQVKIFPFFFFACMGPFSQRCGNIRDCDRRQYLREKDDRALQGNSVLSIKME